MLMFWYSLLHFIGADTSTSRWYYFWSAFGSGPVAWCGAAFVYVWHSKCHQPKCVRIGRHHVEGTPYKTCHKHHPGLPGKKPAHKDSIREAWLAAKAQLERGRDG